MKIDGMPVCGCRAGDHLCVAISWNDFLDIIFNYNVVNLQSFLKLVLVVNVFFMV